MTAAQQAIAFFGIALIASAVVGSVVRRRYRSWWFFFAYLLAVLVCETLPHLAPDRFFTPEFWEAKETLYNGLRLAMACEMGVRTMRAFPGALAAARRLVLVILLVTLTVVMTAPTGDHYTTFVGELQPRVLNGSVWLLTAVAAVILYYRLPVRPFHKAVLLAYIPYLVVFTIVAKSLAEAGWKSDTLQYLNQVAYVCLLGYWNYAIWRRDPPPPREDLPPDDRGRPPGPAEPA